MRRVVTLFISFSVYVVLVTWITSTVQHHAPRATYSLLSTTYAGNRLFGLTGETGVVDSPYWYEANLLDYQTPVADTDYLLSYARTDVVRLPGFSTDHYIYLGSVYVQGSGWVQKWRAPNGGNFAFLHLSQIYAAAGPRLRLSHAPRLVRLPKGTDPTGLAVGNTSTLPAAPMASRFVGGSAVGVSGWPIWAEYGAGVGGAGNSHLCVLSSQRASDWFYAILTGQHRPPVHHPYRFPYSAWQQWTSSHHKRAISPLDRHGHYTVEATIWSKHRAYLRGVVDHGRFYVGRPGFMRYRFARPAYIYFWPKSNRYKVSRR